MHYNEQKPTKELVDYLPPTPYHILFSLVNIKLIPEPLLTIFSVMSSQKTCDCGNITATISDHLLEFLKISPNTFADPPSNKSVFERDWSNFVLDNFDMGWHNIMNFDEKYVDLATNYFLDAMNYVQNKYTVKHAQTTTSARQRLV